jgi:polyisoprenoid-binding protein YceI
MSVEAEIHRFLAEAHDRVARRHSEAAASDMTSRRLRLIAIGVAALVVLVIAGGYLYLVIKDRNAPPPLTLDKTARAHHGALPDGMWVVRSSQSIVGFRAHEKYLSLPVPSTVVGRTSVVHGTLETRDGAIVATHVVVDMRTLKTNDSGRDSTLRESRGPRWNKHPYGRFELGTRPIELHRLGGGAVANVVALGTLQLHDVDRCVEFPLQAEFSGGRLQVAGQLRTSMTHFGFNPPSVAGLTTVRNGVTIEVKLTFVHSGSGLAQAGAP